ncbi:lariat debranching enzyme, partial [Halocaridina rubra]
DEHSQKPEVTKFLALDKCLPRRDFLQVLEIPSSQGLDLKYDAEWLTILRLTNHLISVSNRPVYMPGPGGTERYHFTPSQQEIEETLKMLGGDLKIPKNFIRTGKSYHQSEGKPVMEYVHMPNSTFNPQTESLCSKLGLDDPMALLIGAKKNSKSLSSPPRSCLNNSELNITLNNSCLSTSNIDEVEETPDSFDDSGDIIMELKLTPGSSRSSSSFEDSVIVLKRTADHELSSDSIENMSPIKGNSKLVDDPDSQPSSSSP